MILFYLKELTFIQFNFSLQKYVIMFNLLNNVGLTVILMIIVNNQVTDNAFWPLLHAEWNGLTPTDFVFPWFLFIMGYAIGITFKNVPEYYCIKVLKRKIYHSNEDPLIERSSSLEKKEEKIRKFMWLIPVRESLYHKIYMYVKILRRTFLLFFLGILVSIIMRKFDFTKIRIMGVLQRISLVYISTTLIVIMIPTALLQTLFVLFLHLIYFSFMKFFPVPGCGANNVTYECSAEAYFDSMILTRKHTYRNQPFDDEGLLSTLSAISTAFLGVIFFRLSSYVLLTYKKEKESLDKEVENTLGSTSIDTNSLYRNTLYKMIAIWMMFGSILVLLGHSLHVTYFPYNKKIWSTSFVLTTGGCAGIFLALITFVSDIIGFVKFWAQIPLWVGSNPLVMYILPEYTVVALRMIEINGKSLRDYSFEIFFKSWLYWYEPIANLAYSIVFEALFLPLAGLLFWKKIYIKL